MIITRPEWTAIYLIAAFARNSFRKEIKALDTFPPDLFDLERLTHSLDWSQHTKKMQTTILQYKLQYCRLTTWISVDNVWCNQHLKAWTDLERHKNGQEQPSESVIITHNLKLNSFAIQFNGADLEVHSDGADIALCVRVILENKHAQSQSVVY